MSNCTVRIHVDTGFAYAAWKRVTSLGVRAMPRFLNLMYCGGADIKITSMKRGTHQKYWVFFANTLICIVQNL